MPVACANRRETNWIAAMHHIVADINPDMGNTWGIISPYEKDKVARRGVRRRNRGADAVKTLCVEPPDIPAAVIDYP